VATFSETAEQQNVLWAQIREQGAVLITWGLPIQLHVTGPGQAVYASRRAGTRQANLKTSDQRPCNVSINYKSRYTD